MKKERMKSVAGFVLKAFKKERRTERKPEWISWNNKQENDEYYVIVLKTENSKSHLQVKKSLFKNSAIKKSSGDDITWCENIIVAVFLGFFTFCIKKIWKENLKEISFLFSFVLHHSGGKRRKIIYYCFFSFFLFSFFFVFYQLSL